jgi:hypothetical protein
VAFLALLLPVCLAGTKLHKPSRPHGGRRRPMPAEGQPRRPG